MSMSGMPRIVESEAKVVQKIAEFKVPLTSTALALSYCSTVPPIFVKIGAG